MARYTGADCKRCRREKMKLFLKGSPSATPRSARSRSGPYPPGEHGRARTKESEYLLQKRGEAEGGAHLRRPREVSSAATTREANRKQGKTGENLLRILESRLDNVVFRAGLAKSRDMARQLVQVTATSSSTASKVDIPSYRVTENDIIEVRQSSLAGADAVHRRPGRSRRA